MLKKPYPPMKTFSILIINILILSSCQPGNQQFSSSIHKIKPYHTSDQMKDGTFFASVSGLYLINNSLYCIDNKAHRVIELDNDLNLKNSFGSFGDGPGELKYPMSMYHFGNQIVIFDLSGVFTTFDLSGKYISQIDPPFTTHDYRTAGMGDTVVFSGYGINGPIIFFDLARKTFKESGTFDKTENGKISRLWSARIVQKDRNRLLAISAKNPEIDVYSLSGAYLYKMQIPQISPIQKRLQFANKLTQSDKNNVNTLVSYISDAVINDQLLYLLVNDQVTEDRVSCDIVEILKIEDNTLHLVKVLQLSPTDERGWYNSICVDSQNTILFAYNESSHSIEKYSLK